MPKRVFVINSPTMMCCGKPKSQCTCGGHSERTHTADDLLPQGAGPIVGNDDDEGDEDDDILHLPGNYYGRQGGPA